MSDFRRAPAPLRWHAFDAPLAADAEPRRRLFAYADYGADSSCGGYPLSVLGGDFRAEGWAIDAAATHRLHDGWSIATTDRLAFAAIDWDDGPDPGPAATEAMAYDAYCRLFALQRELGLSHVQRIWHWLSDLTAGSGDDQRYKRFCRGRARALDRPDAAIAPLPPATLVASARRGARLHVLLGDTPVTPVENPRQVSAYDYPPTYGPRAPAFARAGRVLLAGTPYLLVSGTASIVGHESRHPDDVVAQAHEALDNVAAVMAEAGVAKPLAALECLKAYVRDPAEAPAVAAVARERAAGVPLVLLHAPLCRAELRVEFETQMPL